MIILATIISKTSYGDDVAYDGTVVMARREGNNEAHLILIDDTAMKTQKDWQNWLNTTAYLENTGEVSICDCPFSTRNDPLLVAEDVFG